MQATSTITGAALHAFIERHREPDERLYGVADAARDQELAFAGAAQFGWRIEWLFGEDADTQLRDVAPYLISIPHQPVYPYNESEYIDLWAEHLGRSAGILLLTSAHADAMWTHLRGVFAGDKGEDGRRPYLRFYDPRVFRKITREYDQDEAANLFGPIRLVLVEDEDSENLLLVDCDERGTRTRSEPIGATRDTAEGEEA